MKRRPHTAIFPRLQGASHHFLTQKSPKPSFKALWNGQGQSVSRTLRQFTFKFMKFIEIQSVKVSNKKTCVVCFYFFLSFLLPVFFPRFKTKTTWKGGISVGPKLTTPHPGCLAIVQRLGTNKKNKNKWTFCWVVHNGILGKKCCLLILGKKSLFVPFEIYIDKYCGTQNGFKIHHSRILNASVWPGEESYKLGDVEEILVYYLEVLARKSHSTCTQWYSPN